LKIKGQAASPRIDWPWLILLLVVLFVVGVRIRLLDMPLQRDEGEFAYTGQLMLEGIAPYKMAYVIKLPGTAAVYALSMWLFGQSAAGIHLGLLLANVAAIILLFLLAKRWCSAGVGLVASATYGLMSLYAATDGSAAHATQFVMLAALGGILLLLCGLESGRVAALFWSGILFGLAFLLKQPGILFGAFGGFCILAGELKSHPVRWMQCFKKTAVFCLGIILPFAVLCLILWHAGIFGRFWYWSFTVAGGGWVPWREGWVNLVRYVHILWLNHQWPFWSLAGLAMPLICWRRAARPLHPSFLAFCAVSFLAVCVGLRFIQHYFVLSLPAVGMAIGLGVVEARRLLKSSKSPAFASFLPVTLFCGVCAYAIFAERGCLFSANLDDVAVSIYGNNPCREAVEVARYIKENSSPESRIAVLGSEPEIYFHAHRHSATGHVSTYILMEGRPYSHNMQEEMIREIKAANPEYIVLVVNPLSWMVPSPSSDRTLVDVMVRYMKDRYKLVGVAAIGPSATRPVYYWGAEALRHASDFKYCILVSKIQRE
jgi:hypothetical protein